MIKQFKPDDVVYTTFNETRNQYAYNIYKGIGFSGALAQGVTKKYTHWFSGAFSGGYYRTLCDQEPTSKFAQDLLQMSFGYSTSSNFFTASNGSNKEEKTKIYREFAASLLGDSNYIFNIDGQDRKELIFLSVPRNQFKDKINQKSYGLVSNYSGSYAGGSWDSLVQFNASSQDANTTKNAKFSNAGDYYTLKFFISVGNTPVGLNKGMVGGILFPKAGTMCLIPERMFFTASTAGNVFSSSYSYEDLVIGVSGTTLESLHDALAYRCFAFNYSAQINYRKTIYSCVAANNEFNYSTNPTFINESGEIGVNSGSLFDFSRTYITKIALLGTNNEVLAVASLSKPVRKDPNREIKIRVGLNY